MFSKEILFWMKCKLNWLIPHPCFQEICHQQLPLFRMSGGCRYIVTFCSLNKQTRFTLTALGRKPHQFSYILFTQWDVTIVPQLRMHCIEEQSGGRENIYSVATATSLSIQSWKLIWINETYNSLPKATYNKYGYKHGY